MTREEAIEILENGGWWDLLIPITTIEGRSDEDKLHQAIDVAILALRSTPQPGKPLTLEQLREMDGQPVWIVEYPDWGHWELSEDANDYIVDRNLNFYGMKHDDPDGRYGLHKLGWLAYSYPPAHIDRSKWGPCEFCGYTEYPDKKFYPKNGYLFYAGFTKQYAADEFHEEETEDVRYCPKCGRPLTEEAWAELERRLRG